MRLEALQRWLRLEAAAELTIGLVAYAHFGAGWLLFAGCFLLPDLAMLGYLRDPRLGALCYNLVHNYSAPAALALLVASGKPELLSFALIWAAHIAFDRMLGFGLKDQSAFNRSHLSRVKKEWCQA